MQKYFILNFWNSLYISTIQSRYQLDNPRQQKKLPQKIPHKILQCFQHLIIRKLITWNKIPRVFFSSRSGSIFLEHCWYTFIILKCFKSKSAGNCTLLSSILYWRNMVVETYMKKYVVKKFGWIFSKQYSFWILKHLWRLN